MFTRIATVFLVAMLTIPVVTLTQDDDTSPSPVGRHRRSREREVASRAQSRRNTRSTTSQPNSHLSLAPCASR